MKALDHQARQCCRLRTRNSRPEDQSHRVRAEAARDEGQHLRRCAIQPLLVIHQADQWLLLGSVGKQVQHGETEHEPIRRGTGCDAERDAQCAGLRRRETVEAIQHRCAHLVQSREREFHL